MLHKASAIARVLSDLGPVTIQLVEGAALPDLFQCLLL